MQNDSYRAKEEKTPCKIWMVEGNKIAIRDNIMVHDSWCEISTVTGDNGINQETDAICENK